MTTNISFYTSLFVNILGHMKWFLSISLCFCMHMSYSQNYADSALSLYAHFEWEELAKNDQILLDTCRKYFQPTSTDTTVLRGLLEIVSLIFGIHVLFLLSKKTSCSSAIIPPS